MSDAKLQSAFDGLTLPAVASVATLAEASVGTRFVLRGAPDAVSRMATPAGLRLPTRINTAEHGEAAAALMLGPDEWLILADAVAGWRATAPEAGGAGPISLVDIGHRSAGLLLTGPRVEDVLAAGCALPLDTARFPIGRATRTLFAKAELVLWRQGAARFHIEVGRSLAPYLVSLLAEVIEAEAAIVALG